MAMINWVIVGGESGPKVRPTNIVWLRSIIGQCRRARVACFVKQLGARPYDGDAVHLPADTVLVKHPKGGDLSEWPADLRVQEYPQ